MLLPSIFSYMKLFFLLRFFNAFATLSFFHSYSLFLHHLFFMFYKTMNYVSSDKHFYETLNYVFNIAGRVMNACELRNELYFQTAKNWACRWVWHSTLRLSSFNLFLIIQHQDGTTIINAYRILIDIKETTFAFNVLSIYSTMYFSVI